MVTTVLSVAGASGCQSDLDTNRTVEGYGTFGEVIYREGCQRVAYTGQLAQRDSGERTTVDVSGALGRSVCVDNLAAPDDAPEKLKAIQAQKDTLVATVDTIAPQPILSDLEGFLEAIVPLADDGTMEKAIQSLGDLMGIMHDDPDFAPALARLANRTGYRPTKTAAGLVHTIVEYPGVDDFLGKVLALTAPGGTAETEWKQVLKAMSMEARTAQPVANPGDAERTLRLALNLMLTTHADLASGTPRPLVARDFRGLAQVQPVSGKIPLPFADLDGDGLADVDAMGRFLGPNGQPVYVPTPFPESGKSDTAPRDALGRALTSANATTTLYRYLDLDGTVIGGLTKEALTLMDPAKDTTLGLVWGMAALLGQRVAQSKMYLDPAGGMIDSLTYTGFDTDQAAVLDLLHGFIQLLGDPNADQTLQTVRTLLTKYESPSSRAVKAMLDASDIGKRHAEAQIPETSTLYDEIAPVVVRILRVPGLLDDVLRALEDPRMKAFAPMVARLMTARNQLDFNHAAGPGYPLTSTLDGIEPVDRTQPDADYNRSVFQRISHMIHDSNGVQFCNKDNAAVGFAGISLYHDAKCKLFEVDDLALFYILNVASAGARAANPTAETGANFCAHITDSKVKLIAGDGLIESQTGITGFNCHPAPAALNRALFLRQSEKSQFLQDTTDDVTCKDGEKFIDVHDKSIFAWETGLVGHPEARDFYDAVQPLVDAFARHNECVAYDAATGNCTKQQNAAKIFVDLFAVLHEHWASPRSSYAGHSFQAQSPSQPRYSHGDGTVSYEPLLGEVLGSSDLMPAILNLAPVLNTMTVDGSAGGQPAVPVIVGTVRYLLDPDALPATVTYRSGATSTVASDGFTPIPRASVYDMIADAFAHKRAALAQVGAAQSAAWKNATSALIDQLLTVEQANGQYRFKNRRLHAVTSILLDFVRGRLKVHARAGDLDGWVHHTLTQDMTDMLGGPVFAALADFVTKVEADPDAREQLYKGIQYLVNEAANDLAFQTALTTLADEVQTFLDDPDLVPIARVVGQALDPATGPVDPQLTLVKRARDVDGNKILLTLLRNLYRPNSDNVYPASDLSDVLSELNRVHPGQGGSLDADDYRSILGEVRDFLLDDKRGFTRFVNIVKSRGPQ